MGRSRINLPGRPSSAHLAAEGAEEGSDGREQRLLRRLPPPTCDDSASLCADCCEDSCGGRVREGDVGGLQPPSADARRPTTGGGGDLRSEGAAGALTSPVGAQLSGMAPLKSCMQRDVPVVLLHFSSLGTSAGTEPLAHESSWFSVSHPKEPLHSENDLGIQR